MSIKLNKKIIIIILSITLMLLFGYVFAIKNLQDQLSLLKIQKIQFANQLLNKKTRINKITNLEQQLAKFNEDYITYKKQLGLHITTPLLLDQLAKIATLSNVQLKTIQPLPIKSKDWLILHPVQFVLIGNYDQLESFVTTLVKELYFINIPKIKITKDHNQLTMQALAIIYNQKDKN
jgi:type IV pilus assembly protein PilO